MSANTSGDRFQRCELTVIIGIRPKVRCASQSPKDVSNVITRIHTCSERTVPTTQDTFDNFNACVIDICDRRFESALLSPPQIRCSRLSRPWTVEIRCCSHHDYAIEIYELVYRCSKKSFSSCVVFLGSGTVDARAVGHEFCEVAHCYRESGAAVVLVRCCHVAFIDCWRSSTSRVGWI